MSRDFYHSNLERYCVGACAGVASIRHVVEAYRPRTYVHTITLEAAGYHFVDENEKEESHLEYSTEEDRLKGRG